MKKALLLRLTGTVDYGRYGGSMNAMVVNTYALQLTVNQIKLIRDIILELKL